MLETRLVPCLEFLLEEVFLMEQPSKLLVQGRHPWYAQSC